MKKPAHNEFVHFNSAPRLVMKKTLAFLPP